MRVLCAVHRIKTTTIASAASSSMSPRNFARPMTDSNDVVSNQQVSNRVCTAYEAALLICLWKDPIGWNPLARSIPPISSSSSSFDATPLAGFCSTSGITILPFVALLGLPLVAGGGLLLCIVANPPVFNGLSSGSGRAGVLMLSANFQNGAGELVGRNEDGKRAVLGAARRG